MSTTGGSAAGRPVLIAKDLCKFYRTPGGGDVRALDHVTLAAHRGMLTVLVGPDGAGKSTLLRLAAGLLRADTGSLSVLDFDVARESAQVQERIAYMPQRFGLYEDLSVQENLDLYAELHGVSVEQKHERYPQLLRLTALAPFTERLAGRLSGGMKQKLALACTLVRAPELLLLDEPTVGVDPLSRRELWQIIPQLVKQQGLTVLMSTSYLEEAERCDWAIVLNQGQVLAQGPPTEVRDLAADRVLIAEPAAHETARALQARLLDSPEIIDAVPEGGRVRAIHTRATRRGESLPHLPEVSGAKLSPVPARFEDGFMILLHRTTPESKSGPAPMPDRKLHRPTSRLVVEVRDLVRRFGAFTAVDHVHFEVSRGEIFGLLGPNGAGKTTTFRMLCGLLPATAGTLRVAGVDLRRARAAARQLIGYVAQKFSLYGPLTVLENLEFFASAYALRAERKRQRIVWALEQFQLGTFAATASEQLPGGFKRRLAMAAALLHEPRILFLDEPTSGADPLARRDFWRRISGLADQGVTVVITTHFMEEAEYCDHIAILDQGEVLARGTPAQIRASAQTRKDGDPGMEAAFIRIVEQGRRHAAIHAAASASA